MKFSRAIWLLLATLGCAPAGKGEATDTDGTTGASSTTDTEPTGSTTSSCITDLGMCDAQELCGTIDPKDRPGEEEYAESELCAIAALRDRTPGRLSFNTCHNNGCDSATALILGDGRVYLDRDSFDAEVMTNIDGKPILCEVIEASVLMDCLDAFDASCTWEGFFPNCDAAQRLCECP